MYISNTEQPITTASITEQSNKTTPIIEQQQGQKRPRNINIEASKTYCSQQLATSIVPLNNRNIDLVFETADTINHIFYYLFRKEEGNDPGMTKLEDLRNLFAFVRSMQSIYSMALKYMKILAYYYYYNFDLFHQKCLTICDFEDGIKILLIKNLDETDGVKYLITLAFNFCIKLAKFISHKESGNNDKDNKQNLRDIIKTLNTTLKSKRSLLVEILSLLYQSINVNDKNEESLGTQHYSNLVFCKLVNKKCIDYNNDKELLYVTAIMKEVEKCLDHKEPFVIHYGLDTLNRSNLLGKMPIHIMQNILNKLIDLLDHNDLDLICLTITIINSLNDEKILNKIKNTNLINNILNKLKGILDNSDNSDILCCTIGAFSYFANAELLTKEKDFQLIKGIVNRLLLLQHNDLDGVETTIKMFGDFANANLLDKNDIEVSQQIKDIVNRLTFLINNGGTTLVFYAIEVLSKFANANLLDINSRQIQTIAIKLKDLFVKLNNFPSSIFDIIKITARFIKTGFLDITNLSSLIRDTIYKLENLLENTENLELVCNTIGIIGQFAKLRDFLYLKIDSQLIENIVNKLELLLDHTDKTIVHNTIKTFTQFVKAGFLKEEIEEFKLFNNIKNKLKIFLDDEKLQLISKNAIETIESALDQIEDDSSNDS